MNSLYRKRDFGEKINAVFQYIGLHFRSLLMALLYIVGPVAIATAIASSVTMTNVLQATADAQADPDNPYAGLMMMGRVFSPAYWLTLFFSILTNVAVVLTTNAHVHRTESGQSVAVADLWEDLRPLIGRMIGFTLLMSIITLVGCTLLLLPGLYIGVVLSTGFAITYFEKSSFGATWTRCFSLIRDNWWSTFGYLLVMLIIVVIIGLVFTLPSGLFGFMSAAKLLPGSGLPLWLIIANTIGLIGRALINSILYLAVAFQYGNLVEQSENVSLYSAINTIGTAPTKPRATDEGEF